MQVLVDDGARQPGQVRRHVVDEPVGRRGGELADCGVADVRQRLEDRPPSARGLPDVAQAARRWRRRGERCGQAGGGSTDLVQHVPVDLGGVQRKTSQPVLDDHQDGDPRRLGHRDGGSGPVRENPGNRLPLACQPDHHGGAPLDRRALLASVPADLDCEAAAGVVRQPADGGQLTLDPFDPPHPQAVTLADEFLHLLESA